MRVALAAAALVAGAYAAIQADRVTSLPGWSGPLPIDMYSGYLNVGGGKHLHYVYMGALSNAAQANVQLWLNGGPGCSSLEGMLQELGLLHLVSPDQLVLNPWSWGNETNLLYLEAPAGVGFSYADTPQGLIHNDSSTAQDSLNALIQFFNGFSELRGNDFYISGESYAGVYVPTLAAAVYAYNVQNPKSAINLKGIMVGNGCLGNEVGICGNDYLANKFDILQWGGHGLVSPDTWASTMTACGNFSTENPDCDNWMEQAANEVGNINIYDIYAECISNFTSPLSHKHRRPLTRREERLGLRGPNECIDAGNLTAYLNRPDVIQALHVAQGLPWVICSNNISYYPTEPDERQVIYPTLLEKAKIRVLIYNGDADACVPMFDNHWWTASMGYPIVSNWQAWMISDVNVGGYTISYGPGAEKDATSSNTSFIFATIRGAGHMVPQTQPEAAWTLWSRWIKNQPLVQ